MFVIINRLDINERGCDSWIAEGNVINSMEECRGLIILCPVACFQYSIRVFLHVSTFYIPSLRYYKFPFNFSIEGKIGGKKGEKKFLFAKIDRSEINFKKIERSAYFDLSSLLFVEKLGIFFFSKEGYIRHDSRKVEYWIGKFSHRVFGRAEVGTTRKTDDNWLDSVHFLTGGSQCPGKFSTWKKEWKFFFLRRRKNKFVAVRHLLLDIFLFSVQLPPEIWSLDGIRNDAYKEQALRTWWKEERRDLPEFKSAYSLHHVEFSFVVAFRKFLLNSCVDIIGIPRYRYHCIFFLRIASLFNNH